MLRVSIIIPAYNEQATILEILERVAEERVEGVVFEVIVVDDGSTDWTLQILEENPGLYAELVRMPRNSGKGAAVKAGLARARGDYVLFQDADLEYNPADYSKLMLPVVRFDADIVMGSRMVGAEYTRVSYFWHRVGNWIITFLFNILNNTTFTDIYSCYLLYRRDLVPSDSLVTEGWEQHAEILSRAVVHAKRIFEVPLSYHGRTYGDGKTIHTAGQDKTIRSWDSRTGKVTHVIDEHASHVQCLALSDNGRLLASGAQSGRIRLWDTVTGRLIRVLSGHTNTVYSLAFSPDAQRLVSGSFDRTVKVWQTSTGRRVTRKP